MSCVEPMRQQQLALDGIALEAASIFQPGFILVQKSSHRITIPSSRKIDPQGRPYPIPSCLWRFRKHVRRHFRTAERFVSRVLRLLVPNRRHPERLACPRSRVFLGAVRSLSEAGHLAASLMPRVRQDSEAVDVDHGKVFYPSLERRRGRDGPARARPSRSVGPGRLRSVAACTSISTGSSPPGSAPLIGRRPPRPRPTRHRAPGSGRAPTVPAPVP
jgi:hypothetical protein